MSSFLLRRAQALVVEAEEDLVAGSSDSARRRMITACDLLRRCPGPPSELPVLLRRIGDLASTVKNDEVSDRSYLEASRLEREHAEQTRRLHRLAGLPPGSSWSRLGLTQWRQATREHAESLRQGLLGPQEHLVVHGGTPGTAGILVAALGSEWIGLGTTVLYRAGRLLSEDLLRAHSRLDTRKLLRGYDDFRVVIVNEPDVTEPAARACFELFVEDRGSRGTLVVASNRAVSEPTSPFPGQPTESREDRWIELLRAAGTTLVLTLG